MSGKRKVLVAVDGSKNSEYALKWYLEKASQPEDELIGYHVWQQKHLPTFSLKAPFQLPAEEWKKIMEETMKEVEKVENDFTTKCGSVKHRKFESESSNNPGQAIVDYAASKNVDFIIMGTRGLSPLRRTVLGSVSDYVLHHTHIPVAVVPVKEEST
ncbi:unnamed protein product [Pocillopora meandrina]|uniref:UspA domain-containing protein n=1 Tax=Pocillopora meandrina TaxID=46732 RepID=A0AAU9WSG8_9CNID|nr:unnamed protein product [Pocillopora meandrina]